MAHPISFFVPSFSIIDSPVKIRVTHFLDIPGIAVATMRTGFKIFLEAEHIGILLPDELQHFFPVALAILITGLFIKPFYIPGQDADGIFFF